MNDLASVPGPGQFKRQILVLQIVSAILVWALVVYEVISSRHQHLEDARVETSNLAQSLAAHVQSTVDAVATQLEAVDSRIPAFTPTPKLSPEITTFVGQRAEQVRGLFGIAVFDQDGEVEQMGHPLAGGDHAGSPGTITVADRDYFRHFAEKTENGKEVFIGSPVKTRLDAQWIMPVARARTTADGRFGGVVTGGLRLDAFYGLYGSFDLDEGDAVGIVRNDGTVMTRTPFIERMVGKSVANAPLFRVHLPKAPKGSFVDQVVIDGIERLVSYHSVDRHGLVVVVSKSTERIYLPWRRVVGVMMLIGLVFTFATIYFGRSLTRQADQLEFQDRNLRQEVAMRTMELRVSEERYRTLVQGQEDFVCRLLQDGTLLFANDPYCRFFELPDDLIPGFNFIEYLPDDKRRPVLDDLARRTVEDPSCRTVHEVESTSGEKRWVQWLFTATFDAAGRPTEFVAVGRDISSEKQVEEALLRSNEDLEQFAYAASHDLQEPLRTVTSYLQLLKRRMGDDLDADSLEFIGFAVDGSRRMSRLIQDLLEFSRIGTRGKELQPVESRHAFDNAAANLHGMIDETGARVEASALPRVLADDDQLERLFQNLIGNGIKYHAADRAPEVTVSAEKTGNEWCFRVQDNGIGIEPKFHEKVFAIFQRLHGRDKYDGTGIGLAVCKKIVDRHGGRIWLDSTPGEGATFHFTLSDAAEAAETEQD